MPSAVGQPVGVVGIGNIGKGIAAALLRTERAFIVFDLDPRAGAELGDLRRAPSLAELAEACSVIAVSVFDEAQVRDVVTGPHGLLASGRQGLLIVVVSTIPVQAVRGLAVEVAAAGSVLIDAGVTPGSALASGAAVSFVGGDVASVERAMPLLSAYSAEVLHVGDVGTGMAAKIARNLTTYATWRAFYEAALMAERSGVDLTKLLTGINAANNVFSASLGGSGAMLVARRGTVAPATGDEDMNYLEFLNATMRKDLLAAQDLAADLELSLPVLAVTLDNTASTLGLPTAPLA